jgi:molybdopterin converting factor small subunit
MRVRVQYLAQLKRVLGTAEEWVDVPDGCTLGQLVQVLAARPDVAVRSRLLEPAGGPSRSLLFFVDDTLAEGTHLLHDGALVTVLAPMAGG